MLTVLELARLLLQELVVKLAMLKRRKPSQPSHRIATIMLSPTFAAIAPVAVSAFATPHPSKLRADVDNQFGRIELLVPENLNLNKFVAITIKFDKK